MNDATESRFTMTAPIDITLIDLDPDNIRITPPSDLEEAQFAESLRTHGLIEPILVRPAHGGRFTLVAGARRLHHAGALGWKTIDAVIREGIDSIEAKALQAAENAHRAQMHPLDVWKAMVSLQKAGLSLTAAGQSLRLTDARARQLDRLGQIADPLIEAMRRDGIPSERWLAKIAEAPAADQVRVFKRYVKGKNCDNVPWWQIARDLETHVIPMAHAIFDTEKVKIAWQEDVFAEPGSKAVFTTTDTRAFMKAQVAALQEKVAKRIKLGHHVEIVETDAAARDLKVPDGYQSCYDPPPKNMKLPKDDPRKLITGILPDGRVEERLVIQKGRKAPKPKQKASKASPADTEDEAGHSSEAMETPIAAEPARTMTTKGLAYLATAKTEAIRTCLRDDRQAISVSTMLQLVLVAMCGSNVTIINRGTHGRDMMLDVLHRLVTPDGRLNSELSVADLCDVAADAICRATIVSSPLGAGSGKTAIIIGDAIAAVDHMAPLDTEEFLSTLSLQSLKAAAAACEITGPKTASSLRERLQGRIGTRWRPQEAEFTPQPLMVLADDDAGGDEDGGTEGDEGDDGDPFSTSEAA